MLNLPNILSLLRIALIPILITIFFWPAISAPIWATIIFVVAALTDWLDGYIARKRKQVSSFGAFIDPVADKLIVSVTLMLVLYKTPVWYILLPVIIVISREIIVSALREWMSELGKLNIVKVSYLGKWKTTIQMVSLGCLIFYKSFFGLPIFEIGVALLYIASALTLSSMLSYLKSVWHILYIKY